MGQAGYGGALIACAALAGTAATPSMAAAQGEDRSIQLEWSVPEDSGCASRDELQLQIERLSERAPFAAPGTPTAYTIAGVIEPSDTAWRARITLRDASGQELGARELLGRSPTCGTLNVPVALVIVTLADSLLEKPAAGGPDEPTDQPVAPAAPRAEAARPEPAPPLQLGLGMFGALDLSILRSPTSGVGVAVELRLPLPIAIDATLYAPVDELDAQGRGAHFLLWHAGASVCPELGSAAHALRAQLCATGQLGAVSAAGRGLTEATSAERLVAFVGFEPKLVWFLTEALTARASLLAGWVLIRPTFRVDVESQAPRILRSDPVALQMRVGVMGFAL
jgi:hypothetical protein